MHTRGLAAGSTSFCVLAGTPLVLWLAVAAGSEPSARRSEASALEAERALAATLEEHRPRPEGAEVVLGPAAARIDARGLHATTSGPEIGIALARLGRPGAMSSIAPSEAPRTHGAEVRLERAPGVTEWWRSLPSGLEHGVTLEARPVGEGPLRLELSVGAGVRVEPTDEPDALVLEDGDRGAPLARYAGLVVLDAGGARVPARLVAMGARIGIEVDDEDARYPLVVDPVVNLVTPPEAMLALTGAGMGPHPLAISAAGDLVLVGCPSASLGGGLPGGIRVFERSGTTWTEAAPIVPSASGGGLGRRVAISADGMRAAAASDFEVAVYARSGATWTFEATIPIMNPAMARNHDLALDPTGTRLLVGQPMGGLPAGAMFLRSGTTWGADAAWPFSGATSAGSTWVAFSPDGLRAAVAPQGSPPQTYARSGTTWTAEGAVPVGGGGLAYGIALSRDRAFFAQNMYLRVGAAWTAASALPPCGAPTGGLSTSEDGSSVANNACVYAASTPGSTSYAAIDMVTRSEWRVVSRDGTRVATYESGATPDSGTLIIHRLQPSLAEGAACIADSECLLGRCSSSICCGACGVVSGGACSPAASGTECRASATSLGGCDRAEVCDGIATSCPADAFANEGDPCTPPLLGCATPGVCSPDRPGEPGARLNCLGTGVASAGTVCRGVAGLCDAEETCNGTSNACPPDTFLSGVECRAASGACDSPEVCLGTSSACPPDAVESAGMACRVSLDLSCDPTETCDGTSTSCPADVNTCAPGPDAPSGVDGGTTGGPPPSAASGCSCRMERRAPAGAIGLPMLLLLGVARRRARRG